jgi:hypothetical protein
MTIRSHSPNIQFPTGLAEHLKHGSIRDLKKATAVVARLNGVPLHTIAECLKLTPKTVMRYSTQ